MSPWPSERKSQKRRGSVKSVCPPNTPTEPSPWPHQTSFMCAWKMRFGEFADELHIIHALITQVRRVVIETEARVTLHGFERTPGRGDVERDLRRVHFQGEVDVFLFKAVENRQPPLREIGKALVQIFLAGRRKGVERVPDRRAGETVDDSGKIIAAFAAGLGIEKLPRGAGGGFHFFGGALADAFGFAIAPDVGGQDRLVPFVNQIADGLADQVRGNGVAGKAVFGEQRPFLFDVIRFAERPVHFKVVAPAGEFHAVVAHRLDLGRKFREGEIGPLAGEECYGS